jgi:hypothetical protein
MLGFDGDAPRPVPALQTGDLHGAGQLQLAQHLYVIDTADDNRDGSCRDHLVANPGRLRNAVAELVLSDLHDLSEWQVVGGCGGQLWRSALGVSHPSGRPSRSGALKDREAERVRGVSTMLAPQLRAVRSYP